MWIDAHNHLHDQRLTESRLELDSLSVVNGTSEADWPRVSELTENNLSTLPAYGLHPWFIKQRSSDWQKNLTSFLENPHASVGEIGLDLAMKNPDRAAQEEVFRWQLSLAAEKNIPATIHCVKAFGWLTEILRTNPLPRCGFLLHAFSGSIEIARECEKSGAYFSYSAHFLDERQAARREVFRQLPMDRLLVETDAPNQDVDIVACYESLARIRDCDLTRMKIAVQENFIRLFGDTAATRLKN